MFAHGCCVQVGGWYSKDIRSWYWPKVIDHLRPCQRGDVKFVTIPRIEDDQCKDTGEAAFKEAPFFLHLPFTHQRLHISTLLSNILSTNQMQNINPTLPHTTKTAASQSVFPSLQAAQ